MPGENIGVLNLEIKSNAGEASGSLKDLADALTRVKEAVGNGLNLSGIAGPLNQLTKKINDSKALANVGTFLNAVSSYTKAFKDLEKTKFNAEPINQLKAAIGEGIKIGQAGTQINKLREALEGQWNTENAYNAGYALTAIAEGAKSMVGTNLGTVAKNVSAVAKALDEYATASDHVMSVLGPKSGTQSNVQNTVANAVGGKRYGESGFDLKTAMKWGNIGSSMDYGSGGYSSGIQKAADAANAGADTWRDAMSKIVEDSKKLEEVGKSTDVLNSAAEALKSINISKAKVSNIESLAAALERLKTSIAGGLHINSFVTSLDRLNEKAGEISSNNTVSTLYELADALAKVKESSEGLQIQNIKINFTGTGKGSGGVATGGIESTIQQVAHEAESAFQQVESTISSINQKTGDFVNSLIQIKDWSEGTADQAERMGQAFAYIFEMASKIRSSMSLPWGSMNGLPEAGFVHGEGSVSGEEIAKIANETRDIILYDSSIEHTWEGISARVADARRELEEYFDAQKQVIFGNESIKGLWENVNIGPVLSGYYGPEAVTNMIEQISNATGLDIDNIVQQIYELSNGMVDLRKSTEESVTGGMESFRNELEQIANSSDSAVSKIELLRNKIQFLEERIENRTGRLQLLGLDP